MGDYYGSTVLWSTIEVGVGIICACLPTLQPVVQLIYGKLFGWMLDSSSSEHAKNSARPLQGTKFGHATSGNSIGGFRRLDEDFIGGRTNGTSNAIWASAGSTDDPAKGLEYKGGEISMKVVHALRDVSSDIGEQA